MTDRRLCTGCGACAAVCPQGAVRMKEDKDGFLYPEVLTDICTQCGLCHRMCPLEKEQSGKDNSVGLSFAAKAKRKQVRLLGSSGGMFPLLARQVLKSGGSVWGAALLEDGRVQHREIHTEAEIPAISGTKYVQSDLQEVWGQIRLSLKEGRRVLFCGTPCQADALRTFLGEERGNLILVDLICYGSPSPGIWRRYVSYLERRYGGVFRSFSFRDKRKGDGGHTCAARLGEQEYTWPLDSDLYCRAYFSGINLRPACFHCQYCTAARSSDITLGDFWGIEKVRPGFDDGWGCSAVICHTEAGMELFKQVRDETEWFPCGVEDAANDHQPRLKEPTQAHPGREFYLFLRRMMPFSLWLRLFRHL